MNPKPTILGVDLASGSDWSAEVEGYRDNEGRVHITNIRKWKETIDLEPNAVVTTQPQKEPG